jgi:Tol biopolymer transport system component
VRHLVTIAVVAAAASACGCSGVEKKTEPLGLLPTAVTSAEPLWIPFRIAAGKTVEADPRERRFAELRRLTFDGSSSAPAWSPDGTALVVESGRSEQSCGRLRRIALGSGAAEYVSPAEGWASFAAFSRGRLVFAYAEREAPCTWPSARLLWALPQCDVVVAGPGAPEVLVGGAAFDGEPSSSPDGSRLVLTSTRDGDPELYLAESDGSGLRRVTRAPGYDGGARFSPDGTKLTWHAERFAEGGLGALREQLARGSLEPASLTVMLSGSEGQRPRAVSRDGTYSFQPTFLADSARLLYTSDRDSPAAGRDFELYLTDPDGPVTATGGPRVERVSFSAGYDGEGAFSPDGRYLAFVSSRRAEHAGETDVFVARFLDE